MFGARASRQSQHLSDQDLLAAVRAGDMEAYGDLFARHRAKAARYARRFVRPPGHEDVVSAAYLAVLEAVRGGRGPAVGAFRPYLLAAIRSAAAQEAQRETKYRVSADLSELDDVEPFDDPVLTQLDTSLITQAYASLTPDYQTVLWHTAVEQEPPRVVAAVLGGTSRQAAALAFRARQELARAYLQLHAADATDERCRFTVERLSAWVRGTLGTRDREVVGSHLDGCERCRVLAAELADVNRSLRAALWPVWFAAPVIGRSLLGAGSVRARGARRRPLLAGAAIIAAALAAAAGLGLAMTPTGFTLTSPTTTTAAAATSTATTPAPAATSPAQTQPGSTRPGSTRSTTAGAPPSAPRTPTSTAGTAGGAPAGSGPTSTTASATLLPAGTAAGSVSPAATTTPPNCQHGQKIGHADCPH